MSNDDDIETPLGVMSKAKLIIGVFLIIGILVAAACSSLIVENVKAGQYVVKQAAITGNLTVWNEPGWKFQNFADLTFYDRSNQLWFSSSKNGIDLSGTDDKSMPIRFSDGGKAWISGSLRYTIPSGEKLIELHRTYRNSQSIQSDLIFPMVQKAIVLAGPSMTSKESAAAKRNDLLAIIEDQVTNGAYRTITEKRKITDLDGVEKTVDILIPLKDPNAPNGIARVEESPATKYGIIFSSFSINNIRYDDPVEKAISNQYDLEMSIQTAMTSARTAEQNKITAEAEGAAAAKKAEWEEKTIAAKAIVQAQRDKDMSVIEAQKKLEVAELTKQEAEELKQAVILRAQGDATAQELMANARKKLMEADGALEKKLDAYVAANKVWADAISNVTLPQIFMSGNSEGASNATDMIDMLKVKLARELSLDPSINK